MDPFSSEGELSTLHNHFHQAQYSEVVKYDTSSLSDTNRLPARILKLRARLEVGEAAAVTKELENETNPVPDIEAVLLLAKYIQKGSDNIVERAKVLGESQSENSNVLVVCGTILARDGKFEEALALLKKHEDSLDAVALIIQIHLANNRLDLARAELQRARSWAQDALLIQLAEAWVHLRQGGAKNYQSAFYVYEELATQPSTTSAQAHLAQSICELHLGRLPEAEAAMDQAVAESGIGSGNSGVTAVEAVAMDRAVMFSVLGRDKERQEILKGLGANSEIIQGLTEKREAFAAAAAKYNPVFEPVGA